MEDFIGWRRAMSKTMDKRTIGTVLAAAVVMCLAQTAWAQRTVTVAVRDMLRASVDVDVRCQGPCSPEPNISFVREAAGTPISKSGDRIVSLEAYAEDGSAVPVKKSAPFQYVAEKAFQRVVVKRTLERPEEITQLVFRSWLAMDEGLLVLSDLLPEQLQSDLAVRFVLPTGIYSIGAGRGKDGRTFQFRDAGDAVVLVARDPLYGTSTFGTGSLTLASVGQWPISPSEKIGMISGVLRHYQEAFRSAPLGEPFVILVRPPAAEYAPNRWAAQSKGPTLVIASTAAPFGGTGEGQRLHEQLRHELFRLWMPNSVALSGQYAWFYEGFARYESLRMAVGANRIRFEDMLSTLARAYDASSGELFPTSLIEASSRGVPGKEAGFQSKGLLVAFMLDVEMMTASDGRRTSSDLLAEIFSRHRKPARLTDGNEAILELLGLLPELRGVVDPYIRGRQPVKMEAYWEKAGLVADLKDGVTTLVPSPKPTDAQRKMLDRLSYNTWRKLTGQ